MAKLQIMANGGLFWLIMYNIASDLESVPIIRPKSQISKTKDDIITPQWRERERERERGGGGGGGESIINPGIS